MVKHKSWVDGVVRVRGESETRHGKLRLDKNERVTLFPEEFLAELSGLITSDAIAAYPETEKLYRELAVHLGVTIDNLMLTAGSDAGIKHCFELFVKPGDEVVVLEPTFAMVDVYCELFSASRVPAGYDKNLRLNIESLLGSIGNSTTLVVLANPNSPTGTLIELEDLERVLKCALRFDVPVLVDEAYYGFCKSSAISLIERYSNLIVGRTFSKAAGLAGLRVGYLCANVKLAKLLYRFRPMYEINSIGVLAALLVLRTPKIVKNYISDTEVGRKILINYLDSRSVPWCNTHTNFLHIDFDKKKDLALAAFRDAGILVRGGLNLAGYENYLRVTIGPKEAIFRLIEIIDPIFSSHAEK